jgi:diacylglycerol O-acyltransferase / wax synthase
MEATRTPGCAMPDPTEPHVRDTDAFTLRMERDPLLRSTITAVAVFDQSPDWDILVNRIERATRLVPSFRARLVPSPFGLATPRWIPDPEFDLSWHLRRVESAPHHDVDMVLATARVTSTTAFDPARPLWEFTLFDGLSGGKAALLMKVHHALTDGIGGIQLAAHVVDLERTPQDLGPLPALSPAPSPGWSNGLGDALAFTARRWTTLAGSTAATLPGGIVRTARHPVQQMTSLSTTATSIARFLRPVTTTMSPVMTDRSLRRRFDRFDLPLEGLKAAALASNGSMNDAFLAAIAGGMRRYHEHHGAPVGKLRLALPINIRQDGDPVGGNRVTLVRFEVPVTITNPTERMMVIGRTVRQMRQEPALRYSEAIASVLNLLPPGVTAGMLKHVDLVATNVPGFTDPVYVGGAKMEAFYPFAPTLGTAANIAMMSYCDTCNVGVSTDPGAVPDADVFLRCLSEGFDEVIAAGRRVRSRSGARRHVNRHEVVAEHDRTREVLGGE